MHNGLSPFGKQVVAEMNRLGIMIDVSHISEKSFYNVIQESKAPIFASHSGCMALNVNNRNLTDAQLKALARNGGVIQVVALGSFLKGDCPERRQAIEKLQADMGYRRLGRGETQAMNEQQRAEFAQRTQAYQERLKRERGRCSISASDANHHRRFRQPYRSCGESSPASITWGSARTLTGAAASRVLTTTPKR